MNKRSLFAPVLLLLPLFFCSAQTDSLGIGLYANAGFGSNGLSLVPGVSFLYQDVPVALHFGASDGSVEGALSADWLVYRQPIPDTPASWYAGPGFYTAFGAGNGSSIFGFGLRGVVGAQVPLADSFQAFASFVPALGLNWTNGSREFLWNADLEVGVRYLVPISGSN